MRGATGYLLYLTLKGAISIHAPLAGRDGLGTCSPGSISQFQSTRPLRGATAADQRRHHIKSHFNPRAPCGARLLAEAKAVTGLEFQSTRPLRGATNVGAYCAALHTISIHAPLAGRDPSCLTRCSPRRISIHAPLAGRDMGDLAYPEVSEYFNPRAPCGARLSPWGPAGPWTPYFNPRAPCGARRLHHMNLPVPFCISIHAPLAGRDGCHRPFFLQGRNFNPRAPCGARQRAFLKTVGYGRFQSTRPLRGATVRERPPKKEGKFQSTRPLRGATELIKSVCGRFDISIHAPLAGRDGREADGVLADLPISIHAPLAGRDGIR